MTSDHIRIPDVPPRVQYLCDGSETTFVFPFPVLHARDLEVLFDGGPHNGPFTLAGLGRTEGGTVTFDTPPAADTRLTLGRTVPVQRVTDFLQGGALRADAFNTEFDTQTQIAQQLAEALGRAVRAPRHDQPATLELPDRDARAGHVLGFDGAGDVTLLPTGDPLPGPAQYLPPQAGARARDLHAKLADTVSIRDFGAVGDGLADDTAAVLAALATAMAVYVPAGTYRITGTLVLSVGQTLSGVGDASILRGAVPTAPLIEIRGDYNALHDLRLEGGLVGVKLYGRDRPCVQNALSNLTIWGAGTGLLLDGDESTDRPCYWNNFDNVLVVQPTTHGIHLRVSGAGDTPNANRFTRCRVYSLSVPMTGSGIWIEHGRYNNAFVDCEVNLHPDATACVRVGALADKNLFVNLYTETLGGVPNVWLEPGSIETAIVNLFSASAGPAIWDQSGREYTAINAGYPEKNYLKYTRVQELVAERFRFDTEYDLWSSSGTVDVDLSSSVHFVSPSAGPVTARLPDPNDHNGVQVTIKKIDNGPHAVTVTGLDGTDPDGRPVTLPGRWDFVTVISNGAAWFITGASRMPEQGAFHESGSVYSPDPARRVHLVSAFAGAVEVRLPSPGDADAVGRRLSVKKTDGSAHAVTVTVTGGGGPDNAAQTLAAQYDALTVFSDGAAWHVLDRMIAAQAPA